MFQGVVYDALMNHVTHVTCSLPRPPRRKRRSPKTYLRRRSFFSKAAGASLESWKLLNCSYKSLFSNDSLYRRCGLVFFDMARGLSWPTCNRRGVQKGKRRWYLSFPRLDGMAVIDDQLALIFAVSSGISRSQMVNRSLTFCMSQLREHLRGRMLVLGG